MEKKQAIKNIAISDFCLEYQIFETVLLLFFFGKQGTLMTNSNLPMLKYSLNLGTIQHYILYRQNTALMQRHVNILNILAYICIDYF